MGYFFIILSVFNIEIIVTPTSANTACHIFAIPIALRTNIKIFTPIENTKFSFIILFTLFEILIALLIFHISSSIITMSLDSIADDEQIDPIDIPISDLLRDGASFIPSPIKATTSLSFSNSSNFSYFSVGKSS